MQVAVELHQLAFGQGVLQLKGALLDDKPLKFTSPEQLPNQGTFSLRALALKPTYYSDAPLSEEDFKSRWVWALTTPL